MDDVLFPERLLADLRAHYERSKSKGEAGGLLLGYRKPGAIEIVKATFPMPWDVASRSRFRRSVRGHRIAALKEWKRSGYTIDWVGEWHTHPFSASFPSSTDTGNWRRIVVEAKCSMAFLIVGATDVYVGMQVGSAGPATMAQIERGNGFVLFSRTDNSRP